VAKLADQAGRSWELIDKLKFVSENELYQDHLYRATTILRNSNSYKKKKFQYLIDSWGAGLTVEHGAVLSGEAFQKSASSYYYLKKSNLSQRQNEDGKRYGEWGHLVPSIG